MTNTLVNKVVARFADGRIVKGSTADFVATKDSFHVVLENSPPGEKAVSVHLKDLKAVFFVKDLVGQPRHQARQDFDPTRPVVGRKIKVVFQDGEVLVGTTQGYKQGRSAFFLVPADREVNTERCFVVAAATREISFL